MNDALRLEYIGHACLLINSKNESLITDAWFTNPTMANSWYHLPQYSRTIEELPKLDYIYISHEHADHLDIPALRLLTPTATILVPEYGDGKLEQTLKESHLKQKVKSMKDGEIFNTPAGNQIAIYFADTGSKDSSLIFSDGEACVYNHTDNWMTPGKMASIGQRWPVDIAFQCYAGTGSFPSYMMWPLDYRIQVGQLKKIQLFRRMKDSILALKPKSIVPFGASFGYLRPETLWLNDVCATTPKECAKWLTQEGVEIPVAFMDHGDMWCKARGVFPGKIKHSIEITKAQVTKYSEQYAELIRRKREEESVPENQLQHLDKLFGEYLNSWVISERSKFSKSSLVIQFNISGGQGIVWTVDFGNTKQSVSKAIPGQPNLFLTLTETELFNALTERHYSFADLYLSSRIQMNRYPYDVYHKDFFDSFFWWNDRSHIEANRKAIGL